MQSTDLPLYYNAIDILERNLSARRDKIALYSLAQCLTFQQVADQVNQVGNALQRSGVRLGDLVGILAPDSAEWVTTVFAPLKVGGIAVCMNTFLQSDEYDYILRDCRMRILIVHESLVAKIAPIRDQHPTLAQVIVIGQAPSISECIQPCFQQWIANEPTTLPAVATHRDDFCTLHYSSGTTGEPKGVFHAHKDYPLIAQLSGVDLLGIQAADRTFSAAKLFFVYGLGGNLIFPWYVGAATVLYEAPARQVNGLLECIARFQPTILFCVPTVYAAMLALNQLAQKYDLSSLRLCLSAGEALPAALWHNWQKQTGHTILDTIGCTESLHTFMANRPDDLRPGSSGKPSPGYVVKLVDDEGVPVPPNTIGNLLVKGESIALFYLHQTEKSRHTFRGEWLFTGDKYTCDDDGFYWHAGRSDDLFKVGGLWVSPVEVEGVLMRSPLVLECAVIGQPDPVGMVKPHAFIRLVDNTMAAPALQQTLLQHCKATLAPHKCPWRIHFVADLPKTATGKIQRFKLRGRI